MQNNNLVGGPRQSTADGCPVHGGCSRQMCPVSDDPNGTFFQFQAFGQILLEPAVDCHRPVCGIESGRLQPLNCGGGPACCRGGLNQASTIDVLDPEHGFRTAEAQLYTGHGNRGRNECRTDENHYIRLPPTGTKQAKAKAHFQDKTVQHPGLSRDEMPKPVNLHPVQHFKTGQSGVTLPNSPLRIMRVASQNRNLISGNSKPLRQASGVRGNAGRLRSVVQAQNSYTQLRFFLRLGHLCDASSGWSS